MKPWKEMTMEELNTIIELARDEKDRRLRLEQEKLWHAVRDAIRAYTNKFGEIIVWDREHVVEFDGALFNFDRFGSIAIEGEIGDDS